MRRLTPVLSRLFGSFAAKKFPKPIQSFINNSYVFFLKVDLKEFKKPSKYESLNALFTRALERPRELEGGIEDLISPCDSEVIISNEIKKETILQIKGMEYRVDELLSDFTTLKRLSLLQNGQYINLYLSPKDYHRYHAPCRMKILEAHYIPGVLYPVNKKWLNKKESLFPLNERVVLYCKNAFESYFYMVFIGALNVGKMSFNFDERIKTNLKNKAASYYTYKDIWVEKGDELGMFEMGSTIVLLLEKGGFSVGLKDGQKISFGQIVGKGLKSD